MFKPHNEHIVVIQVVIEVILLETFGMTSATPEYVLLILALLVTATLLFVYVRRRIGPWPALMAAVVLLFLDLVDLVLVVAVLLLLVVAGHFTYLPLASRQAADLVCVWV